MGDCAHWSALLPFLAIPCRTPVPNPQPLQSETHTHSKTCPELQEESKIVTVPVKCSSQLRTMGLSLSGFFSFFFKTKTRVASLSRGRWRISQILGHCTQEIFSLLRALTNEAERTLDLPKHGAARACPWLSTALVAGSVRRGRGGDQCSQRRS